VTCPAGEVTTIGPQQRDGRRAAVFPARACRVCPLKPRCAPGRRGRKLDLRRREDLLQAGRKALKEPPTREHPRRTRPRIERLLSLLIGRHQARKSRYRGKRKALSQAVWTAVLANLHPIGAALQAQTA
jgi:Transposase DDE domain